MALGVLNNLSAIYAENYLNSTNTSLQTVLQQLSSGSKINSGADDAAGLSLVNGLQANSTALTQSETNATEGVGLLDVADGAISQVSNLLNRAITLATEASNGTLNTTQGAAANQEYQSILSEINNIGSTTTYNQEQVFGGNTVAIYTGDSSTAGSSIDDLSIRALSASSVGDTGGVMAYSNGGTNVFINLSSTNAATGITTNAQATDSLNASGSTTINVNYLVKGANGSESTATTSITVGAGSYNAATGSTYANTANGLISAINNAGLGLTASFATQTQAGVSGGGGQTGIEITGGLLSAGVDPGAVSTSGTLNPSAITNEDLTLGQVVTVKVGSTTAAAITIDSSTNTLSGLEQAINTASSNINGASTYVTASIVTNGAGLRSLSLADTANTGGELSVTSEANALGPNTLTTGTSSNNAVGLTYTTNTQGTAGVQASATLGIAGTNYGTDTVNGTIVLSNNTVQGAGAISFVMGGSNPGTSGFGVLSGNGLTFTVNGTTLTALANAIQNQLNVTTSVGTSGITMTANATGTILETVGTPNLTDAASLAVSNIEGWTPATGGFDAIATITMNGDGGFQVGGGDVFTGNLVLSNNDLGNESAPVTFAMGGTAGAGTVVVGAAGTGSATITQLIASLAADAALGITGSVATGKLVLTSGNVGTSITIGGTASLVSSPALSATTTPNVVGSLSTNAYFTTGTPSALTDSMAGTIVLANDGVSDTFVMGGVSLGQTIGVANGGAGGLANLITAIDTTAGPLALGLTASLNAATGTVALTSGVSTNAAAPNISVISTTLADDYALQAPAASGTNQGLGVQYQSDLVTLADGGNIGALSTSGAGLLTGTITITNNGVTDKFAMGNGAEVLAANGGTVQVLGNTLGSLITAINDETAHAGATIDLAASQDATTGGLFVQTTLKTAEDLAVNTSAITDNVATVQNPGAGGAANVGAKVVYANAGTNAGSDPVLGTITLKNGAGATTSFVMNGTTGHKTLADLANLITIANIGLTASAGITGLTIAELVGTDYSDAIVAGGSGLTDAYGVSVTSDSLGQPAAAAQNASAEINTTTGNGIGQSDAITGSIVLSNGGSTQTFTMGIAAGDIGGTTIGNLASAISNNLVLGVTADVNAATGALELQAKNPSTTIAVGPGGNGLTALSDIVTEAVPGSPSIGTLHGESTTTLALASGAISSNDVMTGAVVLTANGTTDTFTMGTVAFASGAAYTGTNGTYTVNGDTLGNLENAIAADTSLNIQAAASGTNMVLTSNVYNNSTISVGVNSLGDTLSNSGNTPSSASLGEFSGFANGGLGDTVKGTVSFTLNNGATHESFTVNSGETVTALMNQINSDNYQYGVTASLVATGGGHGFDSLILTSNTYGPTGEIGNTTHTQVTDTTGTSTLSYSAASAYNTGLSSGSIASNTAIYDSSSGQSNSLTGEAGIVSDSNGLSGVATISYSDGAGEALSATDLTNQADAETALNDLNLAIGDAAALDGYIGGQINMLDSVSSVITTQEENVVSAQNAVQATDYASATSNMSKYEILSQTGIAALAQANSVQQEVTKLLT